MATFRADGVQQREYSRWLRALVDLSRSSDIDGARSKGREPCGLLQRHQWRRVTLFASRALLSAMDDPFGDHAELGIESLGGSL